MKNQVVLYEITFGYDSGNFVLKTITNLDGKTELVGRYKH